MRSISNGSQQHRHYIGEHVSWLQNKQCSQKNHYEHIRNIAARPGLHSDNVNRKNIAYAMIQLLSLLSVVNNSNAEILMAEKSSNLLTSRKENDLNNQCSYPIPSASGFFSVKYQCIDPCRYPSALPTDTSGYSIISMVSSIRQFIDEAGEFIAHYSPIKIPMATALPLTEGSQKLLIRINRYAIPQVKETTPAPVLDDVKIIKLHHFGCLNGGVDRSFAEILKQISQSLLQPVTMLTIESKNIDSWNKGLGCPDIRDIEEVSNITQVIDDIISQVMGFLPYNKPLDIIQGIIAPLIGHLADDFMDKPVSREEELEILQQIIQQSRISIAGNNYMGRASLEKYPGIRTKKAILGLPKFHIRNGVNHIDIVQRNHISRVPVIDKNGKVFAMFSKNNKGKIRRRQVYFNYLHQIWKVTGNGRFNRFSDRERQLVHDYSLGVSYQYQHQINNQLALYTVLNPYTKNSEKLNAVEMFGQLVPCRYRAEINKWFIYDAAQPKDQAYEIVIARNEWHLKHPAEEKVKFEVLFSPEYGRDLKVDIIDEINNKNIYAQINTDTGFLWGNKFTLNKHKHLELLSPKKDSDRYHKNNIRKSSVTEVTENNNDVMFYEVDSGCFRVKRGMKLSHMCIEPATERTYQLEQTIKLNKYPVLAEGSIGIVYDCLDGTVIKKYKGIIDERHKSRLLDAKNNAKGFNRFYGPSSATISITSNDNGSASVFVKLKKITGTPLNLISTITNKKTLNTMMRTMKDNAQAQELSVRLKNLGIVHHDINKGNIIYDIKNGFSIIDFDSANFLPEGSKVSQEITKHMEDKFKYVFRDTLRDINAQLDKLNGNTARKWVTL